MILSFSVPYMFSPGVFCAPALLHLLPKQPPSSPGAFQAGLRGLPVHTGLPGQLQEYASSSAWGSSSPPGEAGNPPALQFQECLA